MLKKTFFSVFVAVVAMASFTFAADEDPCVKPDALTEIDGYYQIGTCGELLKFAEMANANCSINGKLTADIVVNTNVLADADGVSKVDADGNYTGNAPAIVWTPIGTYEKPYTGTFDGNGHTIRGLYFNVENTQFVGLFGYIGGNGSNAKVQNVGVVDSYFKGYQGVGGVVGYNYNGTVSNVYNTGSVNGEQEIGGVVGWIYGGTVSNAYNTGSVNGEQEIGGVVGYNFYGTVSNVYNTGSVDGSFRVGGVVGDGYGGEINNAYYDNQTCNNCNFYGTGKTLAELANLTVGNGGDFPLLEGETESPWAKDISYDKATGKLTSTLPYLKNLPVVPDAETILSFTVASGVIQISSAEDLKNFARLVNEFGITDADAELTTNLTVNSNLLGEGNKNVEENGNFDWEAYRTAHNWNEPESWSPIGTGENPYQGTFNGNNKTVSGVFNGDVSSEVGFFGRVGENGVVKNVGVVDSYINCNMYCGGIVGENDGSVSGVSYAGVVYGGENVGGIIGKNNGGASVRNVYKTGAVYGSKQVGGIVGDNGASINNAFNMGTVSGSDNVGGVAGQNSNSVSKAYYNTDVTCENCAVVEGTTGKTAAELATINLAEAFPLQGSETETPWANDISYDKATGKLTSTLPYLKNFPVVPDAETILSFTVASGVIQISTAEDLKNFAKLVNEYHITDVDAELTTNLTVNSNLLGENNANVDAETGEYTGNTPANVWTPIGNSDVYYTGTFDGKGHTISGLYFNDESTDYVGLFGYIDESAKVQNVGVVDSYFKGYQYVGGVVGFSHNGTISNVYNTGVVRGDSYVGGVVGVNGGTIGNVYNTGSVSGTRDCVGGVVGYNYKGTVSNVYNMGSVSGGYSDVGGVVGWIYSGTVSNGFFNTEVTCKNCFVVEGTTGKSSGEFADGTVAMLLHDWCEMDGEVCKYGGLNGSIWGQDLTAENSLPDFSGIAIEKYGSIIFYVGVDKVDSASIDAAAKDLVTIPNDVVVAGPVKFKRNFSSSGYSTIMLPFTPNCTDNDCVEGVKFYEFASYKNATVGVTEVSPSALKANTPYLVSVTDGAMELVFKNGGTFNTTTGDAYDSENGEYKVELGGAGAGWTIYGTYAYKTWKEGDVGLGKTYGFAGSTGNDPDIVGKFAKVGAGAYIYPMRAYLEYTAPVVLARPAANGAARAGAANTVASLPETIDVVIVDKGNVGTEVAGSDDASGEQTTKVIGTINTRTGEFKFANDRWFDLQGRFLGSKKPTQKGAYYNNGKQVIVK